MLQLQPMQPNDTRVQCHVLETVGVTGVCSNIANGGLCSSGVHHAADNPDENQVASRNQVNDSGGVHHAASNDQVSPQRSLVDSRHADGAEDSIESLMERTPPHITDVYLKTARGDHATNKQQSLAAPPWQSGTICTSYCVPKSSNDYKQDVTRESTDVTAARSAAPQDHCSNTHTPPAALHEQSAGPPGLAPLITSWREAAEGVYEDPVPRSPDWYRKAHNIFQDDTPSNQRPISVKMTAAQNLLESLSMFGGWDEIAESMAKPIRKRLDYIHAKARDR